MLLHLQEIGLTPGMLDLEKILLHYSEDFTIETPMAAKLYPHSHGIVVGKSEARKYWTIGLERNPNLRFEILDLLMGVRALFI